MNKTRIEAQVIAVVNHVVGGGRAEDAFVEAKAKWPGLDKAAQLAGTANAAGGHPILWIVGLSENDHRVVELEDKTDPASWWVQMQKQFAFDVIPDLTDIVVHTEHGVVVCLYFETDRAPYMVKTPNHVWSEAGVPWRDGTRTRSAKRHELLSMLAASAVAPDLQLLEPELELYESAVRHGGNRLREESYRAIFSAKLYLNIEPGTRILLPRHLWSAKFSTGSGAVIDCYKVDFSSNRRGGADYPPQPIPSGVSVQPAGLFADGPDVLFVEAQSDVLTSEFPGDFLEADNVTVEVLMPIGDGARVARARIRLNATEPPGHIDRDTLARYWRLA
ncbi:hypothetical protein [Nocardia sp. NBC_01327]|uniref:hypothetical protein n=1 Tax=Nocardia sp. NBC_01327 TaxID=2903593 RepID=UPI002E100CDA|nr:hypothetical protein OG326_23515 [Nocardia sp. NBC_01327]